ncbi:hypothetical protein GQR58_029763 [Nymphon striatum]|nr:hypothetical protein GQR58_029763 [Nymphon striatum]
MSGGFVRPQSNTGSYVPPPGRPPMAHSATSVLSSGPTILSNTGAQQSSFCTPYPTGTQPCYWYNSLILLSKAVPISAAAGIGALAAYGLSGGAHHREKVWQSLANLTKNGSTREKITYRCNVAVT